MSTQVLEITKDNALEAYTKGSTSDKQLLATLFGGKVFAKDATEYVFDFSAVCAEAGVDPRAYDLLPGMSDEEKHELFGRKMRLIYKVFNGPEWKADFSNDSQPKYYPWMRFVKGQGFVLNDVRYSYVYTYVGARLCGKSDPIVRHICKYFLKEYNDYLLS